MKPKLLPDLARRSAAWMPDWMLAGMYRLGPLSRGLRRWLNRSLPQGRQVVEISSGPLQGYQMRLDLQREKDYWLGSYERDLVRALRKKAKGKRSAFDVGANIGYISLLLAELLGEGGRVIAFEALPANLQRLRENIALNEWGERVEVQPYAVAEKSGRARFKVHHSGAMGKLAEARGRDEAYEDEIEVDVVSLDDAVYKAGLPAPELIKMDIEGGEGAALKGATRLLRERRPTLFIELHGQQAGQEALNILSGQGYTVRKVGRGNRLVASSGDLDWKSYVLAEPGS